MMRLIYVIGPSWPSRRSFLALRAGSSPHSSSVCFANVVAKPHEHVFGSSNGLGSIIMREAHNLEIALADLLGRFAVGPKGFRFGFVVS